MRRDKRREARQRGKKTHIDEGDIRRSPLPRIKRRIHASGSGEAQIFVAAQSRRAELHKRSAVIRKQRIGKQHVGGFQIDYRRDGIPHGIGMYEHRIIGRNHIERRHSVESGKTDPSEERDEDNAEKN